MIAKTPPEALTAPKSRLCLRSTNTRRDNISELRLLPWVNAAWAKLANFSARAKTQITVLLMKSILVILINQDVFVDPAEEAQELNKHPEWFETLKLVIAPHTAGLPQDEMSSGFP